MTRLLCAVLFLGACGSDPAEVQDPFTPILSPGFYAMEFTIYKSNLTNDPIGTRFPVAADLFFEEDTGAYVLSVWGGSFVMQGEREGDVVHFRYHEGATVLELFARYAEIGFEGRASQSNTAGRYDATVEGFLQQ